MDKIDLVNITEQVMLALADSMASAAASFSAHGYDLFILARELFVSTNHQLFVTIGRSNIGMTVE